MKEGKDTTKVLREKGMGIRREEGKRERES